MRDLILNARSGTEALRQLLVAKRATNAKFSLTYVGQRLGIKQKSYLSEILSGRRRMNKKYWEPTLKFAEVRGPEAKLVRILLAIESSTRHAQVAGLYDELDELRRVLSAPVSSMPLGVMEGSLFAFEVHCAFALFGRRPTFAELRNFFGRDRIVELERALRLLLRENVIKADGPRFVIAPDRTAFFSTTVDFEEVQTRVLGEAIDDARRNFDKWFHRNSPLTYFLSATMSTSKSVYLASLEKLRSEEMRRIQLEMNSDPGDMLVRMNVQIYPVGATVPLD